MRTICLVFLLSLLCTARTQAQQRNTAKEFEVDSVIYAYYQQCKAHLKEHAVHSMADTLFRMADKKGDVRMQCVALCTKLDHFYFFHNHLDSLRHHFDIVQEFARTNSQPKYYYFVWSHRLIPYYISLRQQNTALKEAEKLINEAISEGYPAGIADGCNALYSIYAQKRLYRQAAEQKAKEIEITLQHRLDSFNLSRKYSALATLYCQTEEAEKARKALEEAGKRIYSPSQEYVYYLRYVEYHTLTDETDKAEGYLQKAHKLLKEKKELHREATDYYNTARQLCLATRQYKQALAYTDSIESMTGTGYFDQLNATYNRAKIHSLLGEWKKAATGFQAYIAATDSLNRINEDIASGEFAAMLGVEQLKVEKSRLQQEMQQRELTNSRRIIFLLITILAAGILFLVRLYHLNRKLQQSRSELTRKNFRLAQSQETLQQAKEEAEKASEMKSAFIQNMNHEIRTPLNSIVGFSRIISNMHTDDEETTEYADIIEQNSNSLLQLVDDVLSLSGLDSGTALPACNSVEANTLCHECITRIRSQAPEGVELTFIPQTGTCFFLTSYAYLAQAIDHLLRNAVRFTAKGSITLEWKTDAGEEFISFTVTDTGIGIPEEKREFVFERFTKIDSFTQGSGLGLPIARTVAQRPGGDLVIDPAYTHGCRFVLTVKMTPDSH